MNTNFRERTPNGTFWFTLAILTLGLVAAGSAKADGPTTASPPAATPSLSDDAAKADEQMLQGAETVNGWAINAKPAAEQKINEYNSENAKLQDEESQQRGDAIKRPFRAISHKYQTWRAHANAKKEKKNNNKASALDKQIDQVNKQIDAENRVQLPTGHDDFGAHRADRETAAHEKRLAKLQKKLDSLVAKRDKALAKADKAKDKKERHADKAVAYQHKYLKNESNPQGLSDYAVRGNEIKADQKTTAGLAQDASVAKQVEKKADQVQKLHEELADYVSKRTNAIANLHEPFNQKDMGALTNHEKSIDSQVVGTTTNILAQGAVLRNEELKMLHKMETQQSTYTAATQEQNKSVPTVQTDGTVALTPAPVTVAPAGTLPPGTVPN